MTTHIYCAATPVRHFARGFEYVYLIYTVLTKTLSKSYFTD